MKSDKFHIITLIATILVADVAWGADISTLSTSGTWNGGELTKNCTINLTGNVTIKGMITIKKGVTLTINPNGAARTITNGANINRMFDVSSGGALVIKGTSSYRITINGGATVTRNGSTGVITKSGGFELSQEAIRNRGRMQLDYVTITNVYTPSPSNSGGAVLIQGTTDAANGTTTFNNCIIQYCVADHGAAIHMGNNKDYQGNTPTSCAVTLNNTTVQYCYARADSRQNETTIIKNEGGVIRTNGGVVGNLTLNNCTIQYNHSDYAGAGVYWNAKGREKTKLTIKGSKFLYNTTILRGGGMMLESDFEFLMGDNGQVNEIAHNEAKGTNSSGGGIVITSYGGNGFPEKDLTTFDFNFNESVNLHDNKAVNGAGVSLDLGGYSLFPDFQTNTSAKIVVNLNINGANIKNNIATGNGGGIRLYNTTKTSLPKHDIKVNIYLNKGSIENNKAACGGGIYSHMANVSHISGKTGDLIIKGNTATSQAGGGIYLNGGTSISLATTSITENSAVNGGALAINGDNASNLSITLGNSTISGNHVTNQGGAIYLPKGTLTIANPTISSNYATTGGAIYIGGGSLKSTGNAKIENNYSTGAGGAFYVTGGTVQLAGATISGNGKSGSEVKTTDGGAIYVTGNGAGLTATGTITVSDNAATTNGGAVYVNGGSISLAGNTFTGNHAKIGGAVYQTGGSLTASGNSIVQSNYSTAEGGAFYVNGGKVQLAGATISGNGKSGSEVKTTDGGAIYVTGSGAGLKITGTTSISSNASTGNGGAIFVNNGSIELATNSFSGNSAASGGAVYLTGGSLTASGNTMVRNNYSAAEGGAFYVTGGKVQLSSATISGNGKNGSNVTTNNGGAIYVAGSGAGFTATGTTEITSNASNHNGGALYVDGGSISLAGNTISSNKSGNGGAIYVQNGGFSASGSTMMSGNEATGNGGSVYVKGGNINVTGGSSVLTLSGNHAANGGVFYVDNGDITANAISKSTISNNYSTAEGGAFYVNNGKILLSVTELSGNGKSGSEVKTTNGGAIALKNGVFSFADGSEIRGNAATGNGGALYIDNASKTDITCEGGSYLANTAGLGGGIYASGPINLKFAANVRDNIAQNGGGLYLAGGVNMTFGNGLIVGNRAQVAQNVSRDASQYGVGGGIYLAKGELSFSETQNLGIYNNAASFEAADIYASGSETTINLPNVSKMNLTGFDVPGSELYWVNDFNEKRYEAALRNMKADIQAMILRFGESETVKTIKDTKTCLDLGYDLVFVKIHSINLDPGDNAAIEISYKKKGTDDIIVYRKVLFMGEQTQIVGIPSGDWKFETTAWSSKYTDMPTFAPQGTGEDPVNDFYNITREHNYEFNLTFAKKDIPAIQNAVTHEFKLVNKMIPGGSASGSN